MQIDELNRVFVGHGLRPIYSTTPVLKGQPRFAEMAAWLETHGGAVSHWVAVDDARLAVWMERSGYDPAAHFVKTETATGFGPDHAEALVGLFSSHG